MKNLSVFQAILLAVFGALAISGILIFALVVGAGKGNTLGPITIWGTLEANPFVAVLRQVNENDGRLSQVSYVQKDAQTYSRDLTEALASGTGPDLFLLRQDYAVRDAGKVSLIPYSLLSQSRFEDIFVGAGDSFLAAGGILGIPIAVDPMVMYWNKDLLAAGGLARPPQYWDEFPEIAQKLVRRDSSGTIEKAAVAFGEFSNVDHAKDIVSMLILQAGGAITQRDNTGRLLPTLSARTAGIASQGTESALRFYTEFADPSKINYSWNRSLPSARAAFTAGDLAIYFGYASEASSIPRANPNLNYAIAPVPQGRNASQTMNVARVYALAVARTSRSPEAAKTVASLMGDASFARLLSIALGLPSARRDVLSERGQDRNELLVRETLIARSWLDPDPEKTDDVFRAMIQGITSGSARLGEAIGRADQQMALIIGQ